MGNKKCEREKKKRMVIKSSKQTDIFILIVISDSVSVSIATTRTCSTQIHNFLGSFL